MLVTCGSGDMLYMFIFKETKLDSHMEKCIFIGYPEGYKKWKFYNPVTKKVIISERTDFDERYTYEGTLIKSTEGTGAKMRHLIPLETEEESHKEIEIPVVNELKPQAEPAPAVTNNDCDDDTEIEPLALRRTRRVVKPPGE